MERSDLGLDSFVSNNTAQGTALGFMRCGRKLYCLPQVRRVQSGLMWNSTADNHSRFRVLGHATDSVCPYVRLRHHSQYVAHSVVGSCCVRWLYCSCMLVCFSCLH